MQILKSKEERIQYIDIARGIGILLVVLWHCIHGSYIARIIYSFHMPLFFISGFCWNPNKYIFPVFLRRRIKQLIIPLLLFSILIHVCCYLLGVPVLNKTTPFPFSLWFVFILFLSELLSFML